MRGIFLALLTINALYFINNLFFSGSDTVTDTDQLDHYEDHRYPLAEKLIILGEKIDESNDNELDNLAKVLAIKSTCIAIGPFQDLKQLREFESEWVKNEHDVEIRLVKVAKPGEERYLVKVDLKQKPGSALYEIQKLQSIGYQGYLVVGSEGSEIVAAKYDHLDAAKATLERIKPLGYTVSIAKERSKNHQFWARVINFEDVSSLKMRLEPYFKKFNGIILSQSSCE